MRYLLLGLVALLCLQLPAHADELTAEKRADIRKMMEASGSARIGQQMGRLAQQALRQSMRNCTNCTPRTFEILDKEVDKLFVTRSLAKGELVDRMVEVYHKHFSAAEVRELLAFYTSPLGKRVSAVTPQIAQESLALGQEWGRGLMDELQKNFRASLAAAKLPYPEVNAAMPPPAVGAPRQVP
ncbi:DUF2059 domain-containing protein [Viridibacterium curvum]|uniref:DUF2059 domain-containing protein n=1 Tax=Viridibacterium curvum TaxID=1101404 RepID=A0ABP9QLL6_9RHOO